MLAKSNVNVRAPGVIKLFGEHAVAYGRRAVALAITRYASCESKDTESSKISVDLNSAGFGSAEFSSEDLLRLYASYKRRNSLEEYASASGILQEFLPFATIASRLKNDCGINVLGKELVVSSEIPIRSGLASSAACFTAFTCSLVIQNRSDLSDLQIIDIARDGDRVAHLNEGAGGIDTSTSFYGGCIAFDAKEGIKKEKMGMELNLILVNTGPKLSTAKTMGHIADQYRSNRERVEGIFDEMHACAISGQTALKRGDALMLGKCMFRYHESLKTLGVSNDKLDAVVELSRANGALGAKLCGGGGGGIAVILTRGGNRKELLKLFKENGFEAFNASPSLAGAGSFFIQNLKA
ncbi:MAG: mevalonate kinase [Candidatus Micrarchaeales archaeon]|jgi:mevalonate kinase